MNNPCPCCGYCPSCGRGGSYGTIPGYYPYPYSPYWGGGTTTITCGQAQAPASSLANLQGSANQAGVTPNDFYNPHGTDQTGGSNLG